jgi:hypothetical protein
MFSISEYLDQMTIDSIVCVRALVPVSVYVLCLCVIRLPINISCCLNFLSYLDYNSILYVHIKGIRRYRINLLANLKVIQLFVILGYSYLLIHISLANLRAPLEFL